MAILGDFYRILMVFNHFSIKLIEKSIKLIQQMLILYGGLVGISQQFENIGKQSILMTWDLRNTGKQSILMTWDLRNTGTRTILRAWDPGNTLNTNHFGDLGSEK